jgi:FKBP-type peptidyl-prolyl cis-trans isomerase SlyD
LKKFLFKLIEILCKLQILHHLKIKKMKVEKDNVVFISYVISSLDDQQVVGQATAAEPFGYIHGHQFALPALEERLEGLHVGDTFDFILHPDEAFGEYYEDNTVKYPIKAFRDQDYPEELLVVGEIVPLQDEDGYPLDGIITEIDSEFVHIDFNHPLAGKVLHYQGKILGIRPATAEELLQGVVKGINPNMYI